MATILRLAERGLPAPQGGDPVALERPGAITNARGHLVVLNPGDQVIPPPLRPNDQVLARLGVDEQRPRVLVPVNRGGHLLRHVRQVLLVAEVHKVILNDEVIVPRRNLAAHADGLEGRLRPDLRPPQLGFDIVPPDL